MSAIQRLPVGHSGNKCCVRRADLMVRTGNMLFHQHCLGLLTHKRFPDAVATQICGEQVGTRTRCYL